MNRLFTCALWIAGSVAVALAQPPKALTPNAGSPPTDASVTINGKKIGVWYHAPSVKGRKIFGGAGALQPDDTFWRAGANEATWFHTDADLDMNGVKVPAGDYTLYIWLDKGKWELIVNKKTGQWGINRDGSTTRNVVDDVGLASMKMSKPPSTVEQLKITLSPEGGNKGRLQIEWENVVASVDFTVK